MSRPLFLTAPAEPKPPVKERLRVFLLRTWRGRVLLAALFVWLLEVVGAPVPGLFSFLADLVLWWAGIVLAFRAARFLTRRFLWRIRTKLLVSYAFVALVPVALLTLFFLIAGVFGLGLVASYIVGSHVERAARDLETTAQAVLGGLDLEQAGLERTVGEQLAPVKAVHPGLRWVLARRGQRLAGDARLPTSVPSWAKEPSFGGLVDLDPQSEDPAVLRAFSARRDASLLLEVPFEASFFVRLREQTGIEARTVGAEVRYDGGGLQISTGDEEGQRRGGQGVIEGRVREAARDSLGDSLKLNFGAMVERVAWGSGERSFEVVLLRFSPRDLVRRISPANPEMDVGDIYVKILAVLAILFLVMVGAALVVGALLARSITRSVHALSVGTERLRRGEFNQPIPIGSRDQLGELAESFNLMSASLQDLLREQAEKERLEEELRIARQIQMSLLPHASVGLPGVRVAALCLPAAEVGGDYYDLLPLSDTCLGVLVADVSGKGTSAALYMAELKGLVLSLSRVHRSPRRMLCEANRILAGQMDPRSFVTVTYGVFDSVARTLRLSRAGHNPLIHLEAATGRTKLVAPAGLGLGLDRGERFDEILEEVEIPLVAGDLFLFFTDGLSEAMNVRSELFGESRLREVVESSEGMNSDEVKERILAEVRRFVGDAAQHDDMTMVILKVA